MKLLYILLRFASDFEMCVQHRIPTFAEIRRKAIISLLLWLKQSDNDIVKKLVDVNSFYNSYFLMYGNP